MRLMEPEVKIAPTSTKGVVVRSVWQRRVLTLFMVFGPGLIVMEADNDAGAVSTYMQAGGQYGLHLLWLLIVLLPICYFIQEMVARLEVLLRRAQAQPRQTKLRVQDLELDLYTREVRRGGREIALLPTEYKLLEFLMRNSGQVLTRTMIFEAIWGYHFDPGTNLIDVHLGRLRRKVDSPGFEPLIKTVRGSGYALNAAS